MKQVFADSYLELKNKYPFVFAVRRESNGRWTGLVDERKVS